VKLRKKRGESVYEDPPVTAEQRAEVLRLIDAIPADATYAHPTVVELLDYMRSERLVIPDHRLRVPDTHATLESALATVRRQVGG